MEQLSRTGNTLASCPLLSAPIRDIKGSAQARVCVCARERRLNKRVLTRSKEVKERGRRNGLCVCGGVCVHLEAHTFTHSLLCLRTLLSRTFSDKEMEPPERGVPLPALPPSRTRKQPRNFLKVLLKCLFLCLRSDLPAGMHGGARLLRETRGVQVSPPPPPPPTHWGINK